MKREYLEKMSDDELEGYAKQLGFSVKAGKTTAEKLQIIEGKREREAILSVIGVALHIPLKRVHDRRFRDLISKPGRTDEDVESAFRLALGEDQFRALNEAATDDDGTVDEQALTFAYNSILASEELKNF